MRALPALGLLFLSTQVPATIDVGVGVRSYLGSPTGGGGSAVTVNNFVGVGQTLTFVGRSLTLPSLEFQAGLVARYIFPGFFFWGIEGSIWTPPKGRQTVQNLTASQGIATYRAELTTRLRGSLGGDLSLLAGFDLFETVALYLKVGARYAPWKLETRIQTGPTDATLLSTSPKGRLTFLPGAGLSWKFLPCLKLTFDLTLVPRTTVTLTPHNHDTTVTTGVPVRGLQATAALLFSF